MSNFLQQQPIILASSSPIRFKLLSSLGLEFLVVPSHCDEEAIKKSFNSASKSLSDMQHGMSMQDPLIRPPGTFSPYSGRRENKGSYSEEILELGYLLAKCKALEVSQHYPEHFIIAADQLCVIDQHVLDKPMNHQTAVQHLHWLSGKKHQQISCLCIAKENKVLWQHHEEATLTLNHLNDEMIERYLKKEKPYHSCGAYQYESQGKWLFKEVQGSEDTILGLPLLALISVLLKLGAVHFS